MRDKKRGEQVKDRAPLPEEELSQAEREDLKEIEAEMKRGECTTLSELTKKYGAA